MATGVRTARVYQFGPLGRAFTAGIKNGLALDRHFDMDFDTAFATGPARPHGVAMK